MLLRWCAFYANSHIENLGFNCLATGDLAPPSIRKQAGTTHTEAPVILIETTFAP